MQEPMPSFIPPFAFTGDPPMHNPHGPVGQLVDATSEIRMTIGQQALSEYPPMHGWQVTGEFGHYYAVPDYQPPPALQFAMMAAAYDIVNSPYSANGQGNNSAEFMAALLLMIF